MVHTYHRCKVKKNNRQHHVLAVQNKNTLQAVFAGFSVNLVKGLLMKIVIMCSNTDRGGF